MKTADEILFRCSSLGHLMTDPRSKSETISETTKTNLIDVFISEVYGRKEEISNKFLEKGNAREEDSITLLSRSLKIFFKKNEEKLSNEYIKGTPDLYLGENIKSAVEIFDTKTSYSAHTFYRAKFKELEKNYYWQGLGYMYLSGAKKCHIAYCLVNGTPDHIMNEKRRLAYSLNEFGVDQHSEEYKRKASQIEINHIFDLELFKKENPGFDFDTDLTQWSFDIPFEKRVRLFSFDRNDEDIIKLVKRIKDARTWMNENLF